MLATATTVLVVIDRVVARRLGVVGFTVHWILHDQALRFETGATESISQPFARIVARSGLPHIRFHDLRHTHASLLVAAGIPVKVVSERLGHAHPSFTIYTYQHLLPGMSAEAAHRFADLIKPVDDGHSSSTAKPQLTSHPGAGQHQQRLPDR